MSQGDPLKRQVKLRLDQVGAAVRPVWYELLNGNGAVCECAEDAESCITQGDDAHWPAHLQLLCKSLAVGRLNDLALRRVRGKMPIRDVVPRDVGTQLRAFERAAAPLLSW
jgi:hypothetical protein